jgi:DNA-binding NtrC family response regulator
VTDASRTEGRSLERWLAPTTSPLELARDGTLLVLSAHRLPAELQAMIVHALAFHEGPAGDPTPLTLRLVLAVPVDDPEEPEESWRATFEPTLIERVRERPVAIPTLARRIEDLRALTLDRLAALGIARRGEPLGVSDEALQMLVEHPWRGDDLELSTVLVKAAQRASGQRVEAWDVAAAIRGA